MPRLSTSPMARICFYRSEKRVKSAVKQCFSAVETRFVVYRRTSLRNKQGCPACFIERRRVYQFACHCYTSRYVGLFFQRLQNRFKQYISKSIRSFASSQKRSNYFLPVDANLPPRLIPNLLPLI